MLLGETYLPHQIHLHTHSDDALHRIMQPDIVIVRDGQDYRLLHGYLHLANELTISDKLYVDVQGDGKVMIVKTHEGYFIRKDDQLVPLLRS
jgi:hypothetical protein